MTEITHQQAYALLQAAADHLLKLEEKSALDIHLAMCEKCRDYASELTSIEAGLRKTFHTKWDNHPVTNLDLQTIIKPNPGKLLWNNLFNQPGMMGKATFVAALLLGYFVIANLFGIQAPITNHKTATTLPTPNEFMSANAISPTPSVPLTLTDSITQVCETVVYTVQDDDTLGYIAFRHGITPEAILEYNHMSSSTVHTGMELTIPVCNSTPSFTATTPNNTMTITPINGTIFPTQPQ